jgi:lantibiotic modifying enzyme
MGVCWTSAEWNGPQRPNLDINSGTAGTVLALADAVELLANKEDEALLREAASTLTAEPDEDRLPVTGLFVGECGIGFALLRAGFVLGEPNLIEAANRIAARVAQTDHYSEDAFCGSAGRIKFFLHLRNAGYSSFVDKAVECGDWIIGNAQSADSGGIFWNVLTGLGGDQGAPLLGYAHGAAGIADALLDLYEATNEPRFARAAASTWKMLESQMVDASWPPVMRGSPAAPFWCHGAGGISKFVFHLARSGVIPIADTTLDSLGASLLNSGRWAGSVLCHGLAGNIDCLLDLHELTGDKRWQEGVDELAEILGYLRVQTPNGPAYIGDGPEPCPDFMVGYGGVLSCFARLARPGSPPAILPSALDSRIFHK